MSHFPKNYVISSKEMKIFPAVPCTTRSAFRKRNQEQNQINSATGLLGSINGRINTIIHNQKTNELTNRNSLIQMCVNSIKKENEETEFFDNNVNCLNGMNSPIDDVPIKLEINLDDNQFGVNTLINKSNSINDQRQKTKPKPAKPKTIKKSCKINKQAKVTKSKKPYLENVRTRKLKSIKQLNSDGSHQRLKQQKNSLKSYKPKRPIIKDSMKENAKIKKIPPKKYYNLRDKALKSSASTSATCKMPKMQTDTRNLNNRKIKCESNTDKNYEVIRKKAHERYVARKRAGKLKSINEMSPWEAQRQRYKWRLSASRYFAKNQIEKMIDPKPKSNLVHHKTAVIKKSSSLLISKNNTQLKSIDNSLITADGRNVGTGRQKPYTVRQLNSHILGIAYQKMKEQEREICKLKKEIERLKCTIRKKLQRH